MASISTPKASKLPLPGSIFHAVMLLMIALFFHMHILAYKITGFCFFLTCIFDREILDLIRRCIIAPPVYNSENMETQKILCLVGKELMNVLEVFFFIVSWVMQLTMELYYKVLPFYCYGKLMISLLTSISGLFWFNCTIVPSE